MCHCTWGPFLTDQQTQLVLSPLEKSTCVFSQVTFAKDWLHDILALRSVWIPRFKKKILIFSIRPIKYPMKNIQDEGERMSLTKNRSVINLVVRWNSKLQLARKGLVSGVCNNLPVWTWPIRWFTSLKQCFSDCRRMWPLRSFLFLRRRWTGGNMCPFHKSVSFFSFLHTIPKKMKILVYRKTEVFKLF